MASQTQFRRRLSREETVGLIVAVAAHAGLIAWMALEPPGKPVPPPPERMTVTFSDQVALESTSPEPFAEAAPDVAPERGEVVIEPRAPELHEPIPPEPMVERAPPPTPKPRPAPKAVRPSPKPATREPPRAKASAAAKAASSDDRQRRRPDTPAGASRIGSDFLRGVPGAQAAGTARTPPAAAAGPQVAASLSQAIARQLKPHWVAPQGAEADQLVTVLAWELNRDGSLAGRPRVVSQSGITPANQAQKDRHAEQAIRAVQLAAPFALPAEYFASWRRVSAFRFDRRLSQ